MQNLERNAPGTLEHASAHLRTGLGATRRGRHSLPEVRSKERDALRAWAKNQGRLFGQDPTLSLLRRQMHGEHTVGFDPATACWWKSTHPGKAGIGAEFIYDDLPPFCVLEVMARELLPSEYLDRLILHNDEFGDDIRLEGFIDGDQPSILISQPDISGSPATREEMEEQMFKFGYLPLIGTQLGKLGSISFYHPTRRIAMFDAHPGNFFRSRNITLPIDGIISRIDEPSEHAWLMDRARPTR